MILSTYIYKGFKRLCKQIRKISWLITYFKFKLNNVQFSSDFKSYGIPFTAISLKGKFSIGKSFIMNNGKYNNVIGRQQPCYFVVGKKAHLEIGNNVGISASAIVCHLKITIEDNVRIGGNCIIYDTNFHSLDANERVATPEIIDNVNRKPVVIKKNVFIGAHCIILKGVTIGENSIVGTGSVVTKSIPENEVWGGNPASFIRKIGR